MHICRQVDSFHKLFPVRYFNYTICYALKLHTHTPPITLSIALLLMVLIILRRRERLYFNVYYTSLLYFVSLFSQVPTFKDGDIVVNESNAVCDYLEVRTVD